jgi:hypothetical protein
MRPQGAFVFFVEIFLRLRFADNRETFLDQSSSIRVSAASRILFGGVLRGGSR